jgi:hypothetical protein
LAPCASRNFALDRLKRDTAGFGHPAFYERRQPRVVRDQKGFKVRLLFQGNQSGTRPSVLCDNHWPARQRTDHLTQALPHGLNGFNLHNANSSPLTIKVLPRFRPTTAMETTNPSIR